MKLQVNNKVSPDFGNLSEEKLEEFFDWVGSEEADSEIFWNSDLSQSGDTIIVNSVDPFTNPQRVVDALAIVLEIKVAPFAFW